MSDQQPWQPPGGTPPQGQPPFGQAPLGQQPYGQAPYGAPAYGAAPPAPGPAPQQVRVAAILLLVQIVVGIISSIVFLPSTYRRMLERQPTPGLDPHMMETLVTAVLATTIVVSVIWLGVWVLFVVKAWQGRNWARVVLTVFLAISLVSALFTPFSYAQGTVSLAQLPFTVVSLALAVVALVLLWRNPAKGWFEANTAYKQATGQYPPR